MNKQVIYIKIYFCFLKKIHVITIFLPMRRAEFTLFLKNFNFVNRSKFYDSYFVLIRNIYKNALSVSYFVHIISFILRSHKTEYFGAQEVVIFFGIIYLERKLRASHARSLAVTKNSFAIFWA